MYRTFYRLPGRWRRRLVRWFKPRYTVGAVIMVFDADADEPGRLLVLRQPPGTGWGLPAGLMDRGENPPQAAVRELFEETGIRVSLTDLRPASPNALINEGWVDVVFQVSVPGDTPLTVDGAEVLEAAFHPVNALPPLTLPTSRLLAHYGIGPLAEYTG
jgi:8-oxo-dGTP pyrophosphatase MutT (NUDIX family)